jgi:hypothetical protein
LSTTTGAVYIPLLTVPTEGVNDQLTDVFNAPVTGALN